MSLAKHLDLQQQTLQQFIDLLTLEQQALSAGQIDGQLLADLAERKQSVALEVERQESLRAHAQRILKYEDGHAGAEQAAKDAGCLPAWQTFLALAYRAKQINAINGETIMLRQSLNQRMLNVLHQTSAGQMYAPNGAPKRRRLSGISVSA